MRHKLADAGVDANVRSAGLIRGGQPAAEHSIDLLAQRGLDASTHRSRSMSAEELRGADVIVGMAREHVRAAVVAAPDVFPRTFTLKELVRRGNRAGQRATDEPLDQWLARLHQGRTTADLMGESPDDDVADPIGRPRNAYELMLTELDDLTDRMVWLVWGDARLAQTTEAISWQE